MTEASKDFHEPTELMSAETMERHRAIVSLRNLVPEAAVVPRDPATA